MFNFDFVPPLCTMILLAFWTWISRSALAQRHSLETRAKASPLRELQDKGVRPASSEERQNELKLRSQLGTAALLLHVTTPIAESRERGGTTSRTSSTGWLHCTTILIAEPSGTRTSSMGWLHCTTILIAVSRKLLHQMASFHFSPACKNAVSFHLACKGESSCFDRLKVGHLDNSCDSTSCVD